MKNRHALRGFKPIDLYREVPDPSADLSLLISDIHLRKKHATEPYLTIFDRRLSFLDRSLAILNRRTPFFDLSLLFFDKRSTVLIRRSAILNRSLPILNLSWPIFNRGFSDFDRRASRFNRRTPICFLRLPLKDVFRSFFDQFKPFLNQLDLPTSRSTLVFALSHCPNENRHGHYPRQTEPIGLQTRICLKLSIRTKQMIRNV